VGLWQRWRKRRSERRRRADEQPAGEVRSPIDGDDYDAGAWRAAAGLPQGEYGGLPTSASRGLIDRLVAGPRRR
jgi:hypothetical protein